MAKSKKHRVHVYGTYAFRDKDPIIDHVRTAVEDSKKSYVEISAASGVSNSTIHNWFFGGTNRPQFATVMAVYRACGLTLKAVPYSNGEKK